MRIPKQTITIKLGEGADEATVVFSRLKANTLQRVRHLRRVAESDADKDAAWDEYQAEILKNVLSVENLYEGDELVTVEQLQSADIYQETLLAIIYAYLAAQSPKEPEAEEKNEPAADS